MPNWIAPTVANIEDALQAPEVEALREAVLGDSQADPVGTAIASVVPRVRGFVASRPGNRLDQDQTLVPPELFQDTVWLVIQALKARLGYGTPFTDDQKTLLRRAEDDLKKVATGDLRVSPPQNPETVALIQSGSDAELVAGRTRLFGDQYGVAGSQESNTLDGAGITDGVSTNGHYIDPPWLVSFPWQWLSGKPTTVVGSGITDAVSTAALAASLAGYLTSALAASTYATTTALALKAPLVSPALTGVPTAPTAAPGTANTQIATTGFVGTALTNLVNAAPGALDTLAELAAALGNDASFATTVTNVLALKAPLTSPTFTGTVVLPQHAPSADGGASVGTSVSAGRYASVFAKTAVKITGAASAFEIWNTDAAVSTVNYEKFVIDWVTNPGAVTIGAKFGGSGTSQRNVFYDGALHRFDIAGAPVAYVQSSGLTPTADGSKSLGQQTAYRWQYVYAKAGMQITGGAGQFLIYNLDPGTSGGNNEYGSLDWTANAGTFTLGTYASGTGLARTLRLQSASVLQLYATQGSSINAPSGTPPIDIRVNNVIKWNTNGTGDLIATAGVKLTLGASTTSNASINIPSGTAPTTPADGDIWSDGTNLKFRVGGATYTIQKA